MSWLMAITHHRLLLAKFVYVITSCIYLWEQKKTLINVSGKSEIIVAYFEGGITRLPN